MAETGKYFYALGRRKTLTATVRLFEKAGKSIVNDKEVEVLYTSPTQQKRLEEPFVVAELDPKKFMFTAKTNGGGVTGQIDAIVLGLSRAIVKMDETKKTLLKKESLMTRDPRMVERKKPGLRKARKSEQYSKR